MIYQAVFKMTGGGLKSFAVAEGQEVAIQKVKDYLGNPAAVSATLKDRNGVTVWAGTC